jgi:hypothetical protein
MENIEELRKKYDALKKKHEAVMAFVKDIYFELEEGQIAQNSFRMDRKRAKLTEQAAKLLKDSN